MATNLLRAVLRCGAAALLLVGAAQFAASQTKPVVKLGVSGRPDQAFLELAYRRGYFAEQGLDVQYVQAGSGNEFIAPLAMNQLQVSSGSPNASLFNALNRGIDIRIVADFAHLEGPDDGLVSIVVRKDLIESGAVKSPADLRGRTISLGLGRGQYSYMLTNTMLERSRLKWSDLEVRNLSFADSLAAMGNKAIDAGFMIEPLIAAARKRGIAEILLKGGAVESGAHLSILLFSPEFAKQGDLPTKFMTAYLKGARDYYDAFFLKKGQDAAIDLLIQHLPVKDRDVWLTAMPQYTDLNGRLNVPDIKRQAEVYRKLGDVSGPMPNIDKQVDTRFSEAAVKTLGTR